MDSIIIEYLYKKGMNPAQKGFRYLITALTIIADNRYAYDHMMKLYNDIAKIHNTTASGVERAIRHNIETAKNSEIVTPTRFLAEFSVYLQASNVPKPINAVNQEKIEPKIKEMNKLFVIVNDFQIGPATFNKLFYEIQKVSEKHKIDLNTCIDGVLSFLYHEKMKKVRKPEWVIYVCNWLREDPEKFIELQCKPLLQSQQLSI